MSTESTWGDRSKRAAWALIVAGSLLCLTGPVYFLVSHATGQFEAQAMPPSVLAILGLVLIWLGAKKGKSGE